MKHISTLHFSLHILVTQHQVLTSKPIKIQHELHKLFHNVYRADCQILIVLFFVIWKTSTFSQLWKLNFFSKRNRCFNTGRLVMSSSTNWCQRTLEFQGGKLNFTTLYCCFCKKTSFSQTSLIFVLEQPFSDPETVLVFSRIVLRWGRNNR